MLHYYACYYLCMIFCKIQKMHLEFECQILCLYRSNRRRRRCRHAPSPWLCCYCFPSPLLLCCFCFFTMCTVQLALIIYWIGLIDCQWIFYVLWITYNTNHRIFTNKINSNNESINCAPISRSSSSSSRSNNKIEWWRDRRCRRRHSLFVIFNNLIILQYNTFIWLVFSIEMPACVLCI